MAKKKIDIEEVVKIYANFHEGNSDMYDYLTIKYTVQHIVNKLKEDAHNELNAVAEGFIDNYEVN